MLFWGAKPVKRTCMYDWTGAAWRAAVACEWGCIAGLLRAGLHGVR